MSRRISIQNIQTDRLKIHLLRTGSQDKKTILFIHGNASSSIFWKDIMRRLPAEYRAIAPDQRGYGDTEPKPIDATKGVGDFVEDIKSLTKALNIKEYHVVGHSMGGSVLYGLLAAESEKIRSAIFINPGSPYGFGGTKDVEGTPCYPDFAGSGGGVTNPVFSKLIREKYRGTADPLASPRIVMNNFYWKPPFRPEKKQEEELLTSLLSMRIGDQFYPGDFSPSPNYPFTAPGSYGTPNALSPKYVGKTVENFIHLPKKPPILWIRGDSDQLVSDNSLFCAGTLGAMGILPNYPGVQVYPPQPMVSQTRHVLQKYAAQGGYFKEEVIANTGHTPYIEQPEFFMQLVIGFWRAFERS